MASEEMITERVDLADLERLLDAQLEPISREMTKPTQRRRACTIDREDMVTTERAAVASKRTRPRSRRMMFPAIKLDDLVEEE